MELSPTRRAAISTSAREGGVAVGRAEALALPGCPQHEREIFPQSVFHIRWLVCTHKFTSPIIQLSCIIPQIMFVMKMTTKAFID